MREIKRPDTSRDHAEVGALTITGNFHDLNLQADTPDWLEEVVIFHCAVLVEQEPVLRPYYGNYGVKALEQWPQNQNNNIAPST